MSRLLRRIGSQILTSEMLSPDVNPRHSFRNSAENLVGDGFADACVFSGVDGFAVAFAEKDYFVAGLDVGDGGDVDGREVHGDTSSNGGVFAAHDHAAAIGEQAMKAVGVSDWKNGDAAPLLRHKSAAVAHGFSSGNIFQR